MRNSLIQISSFVAGILLFFVIFPYFGNSVFSSVSDILSINGREFDRIMESTVYTFYRFLAAIIIGYAFGIVLSLPCLISEIADSILSPWYTILRITPTIVWIPVLLTIPRSVMDMEYIPIVLGVVFSSLYVSMYIIKVVRNISDEEKIAMKAMKVNFTWKWKNCYLPRILVSSVSSLKFGGSIAFILVIVGESLISVTPSLGSALVSYQTVMEKPPFWLTTIIISVLALIIFSLCGLLNKLTRTNE